MVLSVPYSEISFEGLAFLENSLLKAIRHLLQLYAMTYISSHPQVFHKKVFLKVSQNSQEISCTEVSFSCK